MKTIAQIRAALVEAHRAQDWERAKELSQLRLAMRKVCRGLCAVCGVRVGKNAAHCRQHAILTRYYRHALAAACLLLAGPLSAAQNITFAWDPSTDPGVVYALQWGTAGGSLTNRLDAGPALSVTLTNCPKGHWQAYAIAIDPASGLVSDPSNTVSWDVKPAGPRNLRVTIQTSTNLSAWVPGPELLLPVEESLAQTFYRSQLNLE